MVREFIIFMTVTSNSLKLFEDESIVINMCHNKNFQIIDKNGLISQWSKQ